MPKVQQRPSPHKVSKGKEVREVFEGAWLFKDLSPSAEGEGGLHERDMPGLPFTYDGPLQEGKETASDLHEHEMPFKDVRSGEG